MKKEKKLHTKLQEKGVSPVIATVLLVGMVVVIALVVFIWFRQIGKEVVTKFGENVEIVCENVEFRAEYVNSRLSIVNTGNVPIYSVVLRVEENRGLERYDIREIDSRWKDAGLIQGASFVSGDLSGEVGSVETFGIIPVLLGESDKGERTHVCEDRYVYEVAA